MEFSRWPKAQLWFWRPSARIISYLKGITVTGQVAISTDTDDDSTRLWHKRLGHTGEKSLQAFARQGLLKDAGTCKLKFCEHCVIGKKTKVKFGTATHCTEGILNYVHTDVWGPTKTTSVGATLWLSLMIILGDVGYIPWSTNGKS